MDSSCEVRKIFIYSYGIMRTKTFWIVTLIFLLVITVPFIISGLASRYEYRFGGFLLNPMDGNSYLAKMQQGWGESWKFDFLYSPTPSVGAYIFLFYLFLGHLARWFSIQPIYIFHIVRVLAAFLLLIELWKWLETLFPDDSKSVQLAFIWCCFGTGLGWVALFFGVHTADFWVAETIPFFPVLLNPTFPACHCLDSHYDAVLSA